MTSKSDEREPDSSSGLTIRIDSESVAISDDSARTIRLTREESARALRDLAKAIVAQGLPDWTNTSAAALSGIAEAKRTRPQSSVQLARQETTRASEGYVDKVLIRPFASAGPVVDALERRRSTRVGGPVHLRQIATLLAGVGRVHVWDPVADDGMTRTYRNNPSAGARHPIRMVLAAEKVEGLEAGLWWFDPVLCALERSTDTCGTALATLAHTMEVDEKPPAAIFLVADFGRTLSRYPGGATLVWRDAGVLLGLLTIVGVEAELRTCIVSTVGAIVDETLPTPNIDIGAVALFGGAV